MALSDQAVEAIREKYEWYRQLDEGEAGAESDSQRDRRVAEEFGVSADTVRQAVMGLSHPTAGGPIDHARRTRRDLYARERVSLGETEARRRLQLRRHNMDPDPKVERLVQRITVVDSQGRDTPATMDLAPGQTVRVELVAVGGTR